MKLWKEFTKGIWAENPVLVLVLGMCPTLAVTSSIKNGLGMGVATCFVLLGSNGVISLVRNIVPKKVRIPIYIVVIATFVTLVEMLMKAYAPAELNEALGIFIPLIVVNCIVLGRAEAFASKNGLVASIVDALGMGAGFTLALMALGGVREFLGNGTLFEMQVVPGWPPFLLMKFAPGAFIVLGLFLAGMNKIMMRKAQREGRTFSAPAEMNCAHCRICDLSRDA
ncbi:MAG: electron transport complex subunit E [Lentisphaerae bacterium]|jgi:Na+-translocating ferredoxin:NAD+ oxidoreductase subunit E|nr:electron transport complex subunit E [Lentisphaerota bacterium]MBT4821070.1 electron transport complex subunit E [Lentisphaerota bacterium]MBT5607564.1 electron transport complex subunit E [Lentisphaerota bacterium]MBT7054575.1 electron transport complex subunit E [Lentisphaerota bacterium]MBT7845185.1 electron transport complex subunit E [Lentisphaerota bacterium]